MFLGSRFCQDIMTVTSSSSSCPGLLGVWPAYKATSESKLTLALVSSQFDFDIITRSCNDLASLIFKSVSSVWYSFWQKQTSFVDFDISIYITWAASLSERENNVCLTLVLQRLSRYNKEKFKTKHQWKSFKSSNLGEKTQDNLGGPGQYCITKSWCDCIKTSWNWLLIILFEYLLLFSF